MRLIRLLTGSSAAGLIAAALCAGPAAAGIQPACPLPAFGPGTGYHPAISPGNFGPHIDNPLFPLTPGTTLVYTGTKDRMAALDFVTATTRTRRIDGVRARIVKDRLYLNNHLAERTSDYYSQDRCGNVWYFGEDTAELDRHGHVTNREGSFHAGTDGAQPGVYMQAQPQLARRFRQEWFPGHAEDTFEAVDVSAPATVPLGHYDHALRTEETTALEPNVVDNKLYAKGIGELTETAVKGPRETLRLVAIIR